MSWYFRYTRIFFYLLKAKRFAGQSSIKNYPVSLSFNNLPTEYVGAVTDKENDKDLNMQK